MIRQSDIIYTQQHQPVVSINIRGGLEGDSGVGQAPEYPSRPHTSSNRYFSIFGNALILFSILGFIFTYGPIIKVEIGYRISRAFPVEVDTDVGTPRSGFAELLGIQLLGEPVGVPDPNFSLIIPKIHAKSKIIADVDPANEASYMEALKAGVAHASGTAYPGNTGNIFLFAHSTDNPVNVLRYNAIFYLLRELVIGDEVQVYFAGVKHRYIVTNKQIVEPTDVSFLSSTNIEGIERLILQTCWPPGTTLKRLLVFAEKKI